MHAKKQFHHTAKNRLELCIKKCVMPDSVMVFAALLALLALLALEVWSVLSIAQV